MSKSKDLLIHYIAEKHFAVIKLAPEDRLCILRSLMQRFEEHFCVNTSINYLFMSLRSEIFYHFYFLRQMYQKCLT